MAWYDMLPPSEPNEISYNNTMGNGKRNNNRKKSINMVEHKVFRCVVNDWECFRDIDVLPQEREMTQQESP